MIEDRLYVPAPLGALVRPVESKLVTPSRRYCEFFASWLAVTFAHIAELLDRTIKPELNVPLPDEIARSPEIASAGCSELPRMLPFTVLPLLEPPPHATQTDSRIPAAIGRRVIIVPL